MNHTPQLQETLVISELATVKVLADPLRLQILRTIKEAKPDITAKEIAEALALSPKKLYYHLNLLQKHGLIQVVDTKLVSGIVEKHYQLTATTFRVDHALLSPGQPQAEDSFSSLLNSFLGGKEGKDTAAGIVEIPPGKEERILLLAKLLNTLPPEQAGAFFERVKAVAQEFEQMETADSPPTTGKPYRLIIAYYPLPAGANKANPEGETS